MKFEKIKKSDIEPSAWTIRTRIDERALQLLMISISIFGLIQPIVVRSNPNKPGKYLITAGFRRWTSFKDDQYIDCLVIEQSEFHAKLTALLENYVRENLSEKDHERLITELYEEGIKNKEWTNFTEMEKFTGIPRETINSHVNAYRDRKKLKMIDQPSVSTSDIIESRRLVDQPQLRIQLLNKRSNGELKKEGHIVHKIVKKIITEQKNTNQIDLDKIIKNTINANEPEIKTTQNIMSSVDLEKIDIPNPHIVPKQYRPSFQSMAFKYCMILRDTNVEKDILEKKSEDNNELLIDKEIADVLNIIAAILVKVNDQ